MKVTHIATHTFKEMLAVCCGSFLHQISYHFEKGCCRLENPQRNANLFT